MYRRALQAINLEKTDSIPQMEFFAHPEYVRKLTGIDPYQFPTKAFAEAYKRLDMDIVVGLPQSSLRFEQGESAKYDEEGRLRGEWGVEGTLYTEEHPFTTTDEILSYDPLKNEKRSVEQLAEDFSKEHSDTQKEMGDSALVPGAFWTTLVHWGTTFKWELFLQAMMEDPRRFKELIERFALLSIKMCQAWAMTDIKLFISHDDLAMTQGPMFSPAWLRENIFPRYKEIWQPLKEKGIKILFISDGDITCLIDDIAEAGADGLVVEPMVDLSLLAAKHPDKLIIGNIDTGVLTYKGKIEIEQEIKRCIRQAGHCPGYFFNVSGGIPQNVPLSNVETYFKQTRKEGVRPTG